MQKEMTMLGQRAARVLMQLRDGPRWKGEIIGAGVVTLGNMDWDRLIAKCGVRREGRDAQRQCQYEATGDGRKALAEWEAAQVRKAERAGRALTDRAPLIATLTKAERRTLRHALQQSLLSAAKWHWAPGGVAGGTLSALAHLGLIEQPEPKTMDGWGLLYRLTDLGREVAEEIE